MKKFVDIAIGIFMGLLVAGGLFLTVRSPSGTPVVLLPSPTPEPIVVYVTGAVKRAGVYKLPPDSRMVEAVQAAGGFAEGADLNQVNLAAALKDGEQIVIPGLSTLPTPILTIGDNGLLVTPTPFAGQLININTADATVLEMVPGIGPTTTLRMVEYRTENDRFMWVEGLLINLVLGTATLDG